MKFIHTADIHIGMENYGRIDPNTGLSTRLSDFLTAFDRMVDYAIANNVDAFIFSGDAYKTREPTPTHQREFSKRILKMAEAGIPCILLVGNHDTPNASGKASSIDIYSTLSLKNVYVIAKPSLVKIALQDPVFKEIQVIGVPWLSRKEFESLPEQLHKLYEEVDSSKPLVVSVHASIEGAKYGSEQIVMLGHDFTVPKALLTEPKITYVAAGHIHQRQILSRKPLIIYSGSIERIDFGEHKEEKSFELVEINQVDSQFNVKHEPISTDARRMVQITINIKPGSPNPTQEVLEEIKKYDFKEAIVKVILNIPAEINGSVDITEVKKSLQSAFFVSSITRNIERKDRIRMPESAGVETYTPMQALTKYLEVRGVSKERKDKMEALAKELLQSND